MGMMKRTVSFLLVLLLLVGLVPAASAAGVWHSGDCGAVGSNVTWSLYTDGALVISGSGAMEDYYLNDINYGYMTSTAPWYEWEMYITSGLFPGVKNCRYFCISRFGRRRGSGSRCTGC